MAINFNGRSVLACEVSIIENQHRVTCGACGFITFFSVAFDVIQADESLHISLWVFSTAIFISAALAFFVWYVLKKTAAGYEIKLTGQNPRFAFFSGMPTDRIVLISMLVSGAMCGLVGMLRVYGAEHIFKSSVSNEYYFEGLMVAMIARYEPVTAIFMSLLFAVLKIGAAGMELNARVPNQIYLIIQTLVIFFMAAEGGVRSALAERLEARRRRREAESHA